MITEIGGARLMCCSVCCNNVGDVGVDMDGQDDVNIWELIFLDVAC